MDEGPSLLFCLVAEGSRKRLFKRYPQRYHLCVFLSGKTKLYGFIQYCQEKAANFGKKYCRNHAKLEVPESRFMLELSIMPCPHFCNHTCMLPVWKQTTMYAFNL